MHINKIVKLRYFSIKLLLLIIIIFSTNALDDIHNNNNNSNNNANVTQDNNNNNNNVVAATIAAATSVLTVTPATMLQNQMANKNNSSSNNSSSRTNATTTNVRPGLPRVRINKCCQLNEYLDSTQKCMASSTEENWVPVIFIIPRRRLYQPRGQSPNFMTFMPNVLPLQTTSTATATTNSNRICSNASELSYFSSSGASANNFVIWSNGSLYITERSILIEPRSYCVDRDAALVCLPELATTQIQLKKCCGKYSNYNATSKKCTYDAAAALSGGVKLRLWPRLNESSYQTVYGLPECAQLDNGSAYAVAGDWQEAQLNLSSGQLTLPHKQLQRGEYCLEHLLGDGNGDDTNATTAVKIIACSHHFALNMSAANYAHEQSAAHNQRLRDVVLHTCIVISVIFLAATLIAGYMMPSVHHALHWRCQIYYVFCLLIAELLFAYTLLANSLRLGSLWCMLIASAMQFFFLAAFFWLNTMCFNIWWTFRDFRPSSLERNQETLRLRLYSAYAWGIPLLISAIAAFVDELPEAQLLHPGFGQNSCWFNNERLAIFAYFFGPIGLLLCANIILFISTTHQLTCGLWKRDDAKSTTEKTALGKVCLKLVVVMGVTWIADVMSWLIGGPHSVWFITDLLNALQGVFIFIVVGCQPQVWAACKRICCPRLLRHDITNTTNGVQHSSSSQGLPSMGTGCTAMGNTEFTQNTGGGGMYVASTTGATATTTSIPPATTTLSATTAAAAAAITTTTTPTTAQSKIPMETVC